MRSLPRVAFFCCCVAQFCAQAQNHHEYLDLPDAWAQSYKRLNNFVEYKQKNWPNSHLSIQKDGTVDYILPNDENTIRLALQLDELGERGSGWQLSRVLKSANASLNDRSIKLAPGTYAFAVKSSTQFSQQYHEPIVWFEVTHSEQVSAARNLKSDRIFREIPPPKAPSLLWPNQRINYFIDLASLTEKSIRTKLLVENTLITPNAKIRIRNDGIIERELFADPSYELPLRWYIYKYNELIVNCAASGQTEFKIDYDFGTYRALLCVEGPDGILPVSNILHFPLFPDVKGQLRCIPQDLNTNNIPDPLEETDRLPIKQEELINVWKVWMYSLRGNLNQDSIETIWLTVHPAATDAPKDN